MLKIITETVSKARRGSRGGWGAGGARPPLFAPNSLKSPLNWPKKFWGQAKPPAPPPFSNPGSAPEDE